MRRPGMTVVQQARELLALRVVSLHRVLDVTRHVAPYVHSGASQQVGEGVSSSVPPNALKEEGTAAIQPRSIAIIAKGDVEMGIFTKDIKTMEDLLTHGLLDIYYAEQQIIKSLPKMIDKATNRDLVAGLKGHLEETNKQVERLQKVFEKLGKEPSGTQCPAIDGIIKEADETAGEIEDKAVLDAALVAAAQAVEHYELCRYGTLTAWAEGLGHDDIVRFLNTNLNEEKAANAKLNTIALRKGVNAKASTAA